jgi:hypothetical protein
MKIAFNTNGNRVLKLSSDDLGGAMGFSIQTLGSLPMTHRDGLGSHTDGEISAYIRKYGTKRQKELYRLA